MICAAPHPRRPLPPSALPARTIPCAPAPSVATFPLPARRHNPWPLSQSPGRLRYILTTYTIPGHFHNPWPLSPSPARMPYLLAACTIPGRFHNSWLPALSPGRLHNPLCRSAMLHLNSPWPPAASLRFMMAWQLLATFPFHPVSSHLVGLWGWTDEILLLLLRQKGT